MAEKGGIIGLRTVEEEMPVIAQRPRLRSLVLPFGAAFGLIVLGVVIALSVARPGRMEDQPWMRNIRENVRR